MERNHKVLMLMMRAFAPSVATASDATTTSGLGNGLGSGDKGMTDGRSHPFK